MSREYMKDSRHTPPSRKPLCEGRGKPPTELRRRPDVPGPSGTRDVSPYLPCLLIAVL